MTRHHRFGLIVLALLASCAHGGPSDPRVVDLTAVDAELTALSEIARAHPPRVSSEGQREEIVREWKKTEGELKALAHDRPNDARIQAKLRKAIELAAPAPLPRGLRALTLAYYYEGRFADALATADEYLSLVPEDGEFRKFRTMVAQINGGGALAWHRVVA